MKKSVGIRIVLLMFTGFAVQLSAQTLSIPVGQQAPELQGIEVPHRGMTEDAVEARFGTPSIKSSPVGEPPISYWTFDNYHVYFESGRVLHTVLRHGH